MYVAQSALFAADGKTGQAPVRRHQVGRPPVPQVAVDGRAVVPGVRSTRELVLEGAIRWSVLPTPLLPC